MDPNELSQRLTHIQTQWTLVFQAHQGGGDAQAAAQQLLLHYYGAVYRYLLGVLRDPDAAEELAQEFAVRFLRGDFKHADPQRGRFRDFLKAAVRHLALKHWRQQKRQKAKGPLPLPKDSSDVTVSGPDDLDSDREFLRGWREELLARTWEALARTQDEARSPYYAVLRLKVEHPEGRSAEMAERLGPQLGKVFTEAGMRQTLCRARQLFAELLLDEVARSLETSDPEQLEQELIELGLLDYCRSALRRRRDTP